MKNFMRGITQRARGRNSAAQNQEKTNKSVARRKYVQFESIEPRVLMAGDVNPAVVAINGTISAQGEVDQYNFTLTNDIKVVFDSLTNNPNLNWSLSGVQGTVVNERSFSSSDSSSLTGSPTLDLTAGDYTITVDGGPDATGDYSFKLLDLQSAYGISHDTAVTGQISPANETNVYKFDATAGDHFYLDVTGRSGGDVTWQLLDSSGQQVFGPTAMNSASQDVDVAVMPASGTYTLLVEGKIGATETANYSFNAQLLPAGYISPSAPTPTNSWIGASGGNWSVASNWSTGVVPTSADDVSINIPAGQTVTISSGTVSVKSLTCNGNLTISGNATLNLNGTSCINGNLTLAGGTLGGTGALTVTGAFDVTGASWLTGGGTFISQGVSSVNIGAANGCLVFGGGKTWINQGTLTVGGDDFITFGGTGGTATNTLTNAAGATLNLSSTNGTPIAYTSGYLGTAMLNNYGTLNQTAVGNHTIASSIAFNNAGTVNANAGGLIIAGGGTDTGLYNVEAGTAIGFSGNTRALNSGSNFTGVGTIAVTGATVNVNGLMNLTASNTLLSISSGTLNFNNSVTLARLEMKGGTLDGTGAVTVACAFNVTGTSTLNGTGTFTTQGTSLIDIAGGRGYLTISGGKTWINQGTLTVGGDDFLYFNSNGNVLTNAARATLNLSSADSMPIHINSSYTGTLNNAGTLNQGVAELHGINGNITFNNTGTVNVNAGTLSIGGGGADTGIYNVDAGTSLEFGRSSNISIRNLSSGSKITGAGTLSLSGSFATVNANGLLDIATGGLSVSSGTFNIGAGAAAGAFAQVTLSGGTLNFNNSVTLARLEMKGGTLGGTGAVTITGAFNVTSGSTLSGTGTFTTQGTSTVSMTATYGNLYINDGKTWTNQGALTVGGDERIYIYNGTLTNAADAMLNLSSSNGNPIDGSGTLNNYGTLKQTVTGAHRIGASTINNTGTVNVNTGTLTYNNNFTNQGTINIAPGALMSLGGSFTNGAQATIRVGLRNAGTIGVLAVAGTASLNGTLAVYLDGGYVPTSSDVFSVMTYLSRAGAFSDQRGESPGALMDFTIDTTSSLTALKVKSVNVTTVVPGVDLVVTGLGLAAGTVLQSGNIVTIVWQDNNTGTLATSSSWIDRLEVRNANNERIADIHVPYDATVNGSLAAGASIARQATFVLPQGNAGAGNLSFTVTTDVANTVAEINIQGSAEDNNSSPSLNLTSALAPYPDLVVTDVLPTPAAGWLSGDTVIVNWKTRNQGTGATIGSWAETLVVRNRTTGHTLFTQNVSYDAITYGDIAAGGFRDRNITLTWPTGADANGQIEFTVTTDSSAQLFENNAESNNASQSTILSSPDLTVSNLTSDKPAPKTGDLITLNWNDINSGNTAIPAGWYDHIKVTNQSTGKVLVDQQLRYDPSVGGTLPSGASASRSYSFRLADGNAGAGNLLIQITADQNTSDVGSIAEVNAAGAGGGSTGESNNSASLNLTSTLAPYPDLQVTDLAVTPTGGWQPAGTVTVTWKTRNQGDGATSGSWAETLVVHNRTTGHTLFSQNLSYDAATFGDIAGGDVRDRSATLTWPADGSEIGELEFSVTTDSSAQIFENKIGDDAEKNNSGTLTVISAPDLQVANLHTTPDTAQAGSDLTIQWDDINAGNAPTPGGWFDHIVVVNTTTGKQLINTSVYYDPAQAGNGAVGSGQTRSRSY